MDTLTAETRLESMEPASCDQYNEILVKFASKLPALEGRLLIKFMSDTIMRNKLAAILSVVPVRDKSSWQTCSYKILHLLNSHILEQTHALFVELFQSITTDKAKLLAKESVQRMGLNLTNTALVYGEIDFSSFASILERVNPRAGSVFVDLGHGTGKALICASLLFGNIFSRIHGIEILDSLYENSVDVLERYQTMRAADPSYASLFGPNAPTASITVCQGDMLKDDHSSDDHAAVGVDASHEHCLRGEYFDWGLAGTCAMVLVMVLCYCCKVQNISSTTVR